MRKWFDRLDKKQKIELYRTISWKKFINQIILFIDKK